MANDCANDMTTYFKKRQKNYTLTNGPVQGSYSFVFAGLYPSIFADPRFSKRRFSFGNAQI